MLSEIKQKRTVLVIEDDLDLQEVMVAQLTQIGYGATASSSISCALTKLANQRFDCILLDLKLGNEHGLKIIERVRNNSSSLNSNTPIVLCSGAIELDIITEYKELIDGALVKPASRVQIKEKLESVFSTRKNHNTRKNSIKYVLVVDDDNDFLSLMKEALKGHNTKVITSNSKKDALQKLSRQKFDSILLDFHIGADSGADIVDSLKKDSFGINHKTKILVVSGCIDEHVVNLINLLNPEITDFLEKGSSLEIIRQKVAKAA